eukprot:TRINITY_DN26000_c0_g1_i1.p1 TRINITY_DN26000_c0_g1~~TRINITY_DN26000_c0_g1_i1.p1  ORF type:complete len:472 (+),score=210.45 TRINITY_DN26000_c0_g1_i1:49-1464(+)
MRPMMLLCAAAAVVQAADMDRLGYGRAPNDPFFHATRSAESEVYVAPLDHFGEGAAGKITIRYWLDTSCHEKGGPVFVRMGGEGESGAASCGSNDKQYGAAVLSLEHRFYGKSLPLQEEGDEVPPLDARFLKYLSVEQNLEDAKAVVELVKQKLNATKAIAFGGSYSAAACAWFRQKHPEVVNGCIASSGVVNTILDMHVWDSHVRTALQSPKADVGCDALLRKAVDSLENVFAAGRGDEFKKKFGASNLIGTKFGDEDFFFAVSDGAQSLDQYGQKKLLCDALEALPQDPEPTDDERIENLRELVEKYQGKGFVSGHYYDTEKLKHDTNTSDGGVGNRQWRWQKCHEVGYLQTAPKVNSLRSVPYNSYELLLAQCAYIFDMPQQEVVALNAAFTKHYYGRYTKEGSNTFFIDYSDDPWLEASLLQDMSPTVQTCMVTCDGCGHCGSGAGSYADACNSKATAKIAEFLASP